MEDDAAKKKEKPMTFARKFYTRLTLLTGLNQLAIMLDSKQARTSFGKLPLSDEVTSPNFAFSKAKREEQAKVFLGELTVQENMAKGSPGPIYLYNDRIKYKSALETSFGLASRIPQEKPRYDFYENALFLDDPI